MSGEIVFEVDSCRAELELFGELKGLFEEELPIREERSPGLEYLVR